MLSTQEFDHRHELAKALEQRFLEIYFGTHPDVIEFAKKLIFDGKKEGAKELNRAINVLGFKSDPSAIIRKITEKHYKKELAEESEDFRARMQKVREKHALENRFIFIFIGIALIVFVLLLAIK